MSTQSNNSPRKFKIKKKEKPISSFPQDTIPHPHSVIINGGQIQIGNQNFQNNHPQSPMSLYVPDQKLLEDFSNTFLGDMVEDWFYQIELTTLNAETPVKMEAGLTKFKAAHRRFRNVELKESAENFLHSLNEFLDFTRVTLHPIPDGRIKFYGGISDEIIIKHYEKYNLDYKDYVNLGRAIVISWRQLQSTVQSVAPNFEWKS